MIARPREELLCLTEWESSSLHWVGSLELYTNELQDCKYVKNIKAKIPRHHNTEISDEQEDDFLNFQCGDFFPFLNVGLFVRVVLEANICNIDISNHTEMKDLAVTGEK